MHSLRMSNWKFCADASVLHSRRVLYAGRRLRISTFGFFAAIEAVVVFLIISFFLYLKDVHPKGWVFASFVFVVLVVIAASKGIGIIRHWNRLSGHWALLISRVGCYFHGGLVGGIVAGSLAAAAMEIDTFVLFDGAAWGLLLGQSIGRLGCFSNGCCYGKPTKAPWGVVYRDYRTRVLRVHPDWHGTRLHPVQLYAALMDLAGFVAASVLVASSATTGVLASATLTFLGFGRLWLERFRYDIYEGGNRDWTTATLAWISALAGGGVLIDSLVQHIPPITISHPITIDSFTDSVATNAKWLLPVCAFTFVTVLAVYGIRLRRPNVR